MSPISEEIVKAVIENGAGVFAEYSRNPVTRDAAYGLAIHHIMYLLDIDAPTACLMYPKP
jgi:hypothetical protein